MTAKAIRAAVATYRDPAAVARWTRDAVPGGMEDLIALLVVPTDDLRPAAAEFGMTAAELRAAARFFIVHAVCHPGADDYRLIGCAASDSRDQMRRNRRLLLLWLHPDAGHGDGNPGLYQRVNEAWRRIEGDAADSAGADADTGAKVGAGTGAGTGRAVSHAVARRPAYRRGGRGRPQQRIRRRHPFTGIARRLAFTVLALALATACAVVLMDLIVSWRQCPGFLSGLPFCQFDGGGHVT